MTRLEAIAEEFRSVDGRTRLELLLEWAERLPALPAAYHGLRDAGIGMVHECQSPVFLVVEVHGETVAIKADVPHEAPTARSFMALLIGAFDGAPPQDVIAAPDDILHRLGIVHLLGMQRTRGLSAVYRRVKSEVARQIE